MRTTNPVLTRLGTYAAQERVTTPEVFGDQSTAYPTAGTAVAAPTVRPMTVDDVVVRTVGLLALVAGTAAAVWITTDPGTGVAIAFPAMIAGIVLGLVISLARITNPVMMIIYALVMGAFLGGVSQAYNAASEGIVLQAVVATLGVFLTMAFLYKSGRIRATPRFVKFMTGALIGCASVILLNLVITLFTGQATILRDGGPISIIASLVFIVVAALSFVLSFHEVEEGVRLGLPQKYAWVASFGILVSLIWLYIEVLRLIGYFSSE